MRHLALLVVLATSLSAQAADPFAYYQWGLWNQGQPQMVDLDPLQTYKVQARNFEDVRLPSPLVAPKKVIVAVLDTGIQKDHPDLKNVIHRKESECKALAKFEACLQDKSRKECEAIWMSDTNPEVDQDKNGYPLDCQGWSLMPGEANVPINFAGIRGRPDFGDDQGHGTHVSGIIAAEVDNGIGLRGISRNVEILPVQVLGRQPNEPVKVLSIYDSPKETGREKMSPVLGELVARGVIYAMNSGAQVINFSMGWPESHDSEFMKEVIKEAQRRGIIIVAAAGNDSTRALLRPCGYENVICVGATGPDGAAAHFSNFGSGVDIMAPGVNILSTYPESKRPVRFRSTLGYEYLSGTSQATPFVAGAVAEMLARGIPASEVYPRLIASARAMPGKLPLMVGGSHLVGNVLSPEKETYIKYSTAGNMSLAAALKVAPEPVIVPQTKNKIEIPWDRKSANLKFEISLVNKWVGVETSKVQINSQFIKPHAEAVRPELVGVTPAAPYKSLWDKDEVRKFVVEFKITDTADPSESRIPSELELSLDISIAGTSVRRFVVESEITVTLSEQSFGADVEVIPLQGLPKGRLSFLPIDENLDGKTEQRDYFAVLEQNNAWQVWLVSQKGTGVYNTVGGTKIRLEGNVKNIRDQVLTRIDTNNDGRSEFVLGLLEDNSDEEEDIPSPMTFYVFDQDMKLIESFKYSGEKAPLPFRVYWQTVGGKKFPAWVGGGYDPERKRSLRDRWENPTNHENPDSRFYYLNGKAELKAIDKHNGYDIIDIIEPRNEQLQAGRIPVVLAKNLGTEAKPSYMYSFAVAEIVNGKVENFMELDLFGDKNTYRNILDTRVDHVLSLDKTADQYAGSFWFGDGLDRHQRLTLFDPKNWELVDDQLGPQRSQFDSALWVRAVFSGQKRKGAFVLTLSEIQYHDLMTKQVVSKSFERYSFYPNMLMTSLYEPLTLVDSRDASVRLPALFTTESSQLSRGVKMLVPVFAKDGSPVELVSPARMRFKSSPGCKPLDTPVFVGRQGAHAFDYRCSDKFLRVHLRY